MVKLKFDFETRERLDIFLSKKLSVSRSKIQKKIKAEQVLVNNKIIKKGGFNLNFGDQITFEDVEVRKDCPSDKSDEVKKNFKLEVVKESKDYIVVNKPSGILVHPTQANEKNTLKDLILSKYPDIVGVGGKDERPGIVHRLDKEASGLLVVARNDEMFYCLKKQFKNREVEKKYMVLVHGVIESDHGIIDFDIDRGKEGKMVSRPKIDKLKVKNVDKIQEGKEAITEFWVEKRFIQYTFLRVKIHTGRTHQIRVHLFAYCHPVVGDNLYLNNKLNRKLDSSLGRLFLQANFLKFKNLQGEEITNEIDLKDELKEILTRIK